jgi:hypothetical protein
MKNTLITAALMTALASGAALAQSPAPADSSTPQAQPPAQSSQPQAAPPPAQAPAAAPAGANQAQAQSTPRIAPGSIIPVQLTKTLDAKKAKPGDPVLAKVTMDMKTNSGEVIVPKDTKVTGHVTAAQARGKDQKESQLAIAFDHAALKSGDVSLPMSIQAVIAPPSNNANGDSSGGNPGGGGGGGRDTPAASGSTATSPMGAERSSSNSQTQPATPSPTAVPTTSSDTAQGSGARPSITGSTQGVVGISDLKLESAQNATQGSVLSSEKNNVKVESGTMLLLKVTQ